MTSSPITSLSEDRPVETQRPQGPSEPLAAKVSAITALFWVIKILTTGMGEAASDGLGETSLALGGIVGVGGFVLALWLQLRSDRYHAPTYWFCVSMVAVFGTIMADILHVATGLSYYVTSAFYAAAVAVLFRWWHRSEGTLSIHHVDTRRRERFYWATVLATFALGTAVGDLTGLTMHLGFLPSGFLFLAAILVPLAAWRLGVNATLAFWAAYVLTRPLGASFADWIGKDHAIGNGLGFGDLRLTAILCVAIAALVTWAHRSGHDIQEPIPVDA
ncbi:putative membrane-anchored protein [Nocardioides ginsengisegetis]|uniref:Putative membrane-anchored protein n=1 Tax=Nocardioides ginsengisegetis TaxID=661491 RepID=A0A7W3P9V0_9ACTN|nr:putative membrane-anchored protein [Nocardioides ginsengisegetis]